MSVRTEGLRRGSGLLAEETREVRRIGKGEIVGDLADRKIGEDELALRFRQNALADQVAGGDPGGALDVVVETIGRHRQFRRVESDMPLAAEMILDQAAQCL